MVFRRLIDHFRNIFKSRSAYASEGDTIAADPKRLDAEDPAWNRGARIASAVSAFEIGMTRELIFKIYGEDVASEAERQHQERLGKKDQ
jgi:hypothetical protein